MSDKLKKILFSKWSRMILSTFLIYFAFRKADLLKLLSNLSSVSWQLVVVLILLSVISMLIGGLRWAILVLGKVNFNDILFLPKLLLPALFTLCFFPHQWVAIYLNGQLF